MKYITLLRGINISGKNKISMNELKKVLEENEERLNKFTNSIIDYSKSVEKVIVIPEEDAIYLNDAQIEILGTKPYYIFENGILEKFEI